MDSSNAKSVLETFANQTPSLKSTLEAIYLLYDKKYWHQLTIALADLCNKSSSFPVDEQQAVVQMFQLFVVPFVWERINSIEFSNMINSVSKGIPKLEERIVFINECTKKTLAASKVPSQQAILNCTCYAGRLMLHAGPIEGKKPSRVMEECQELYDAIGDAVDSEVKSHFLLFCCEYDKFLANYNSFYRTCLNYLGSISLSSLSKEEAEGYAHDLGIAALLGSKLHNFGELLMHPIIETLRKGRNEALLSLLYAFNQGNVQMFESHAAYMLQHPALKANVEQLKKKMCLMTLLELVFQSIAANSKQLSFQNVADATGVPLQDLELLLMQAMSSGIIQGSIDQLNGILNVSNVQPRVFNEPEQIRSMAHSVRSLKDKVSFASQITVQEAAEFIPSLSVK